MSAIDHVRAAETLQFGPFAFHVHRPGADFDRTTQALCRPKPAGELAFALPASLFDLPIPDTFPFTGNVVGPNTVVWNLDVDINRKVFGIVHVGRVRGSIKSQLTEIPAHLGTASDGTSQRVFLAQIDATAGEGCIVAETSIGATTVTNITAQVAAGEELRDGYFDAHIQAHPFQNDGGGYHFLTQGSTVRCTASVDNLHVTGNNPVTTYQWQVPSGATAIGGTSDPILTLRLDGAGAVLVGVQVVVQTDVQSVNRTRTVNYTVLTQEEAEQRRMMCELRQRLINISHGMMTSTVARRGVGPGLAAGGIRLVDPLWDPTPEVLREGTAAPIYSPSELHRLRQDFERIAHQATALAKHTTHLIARRAGEVKQLEGPLKLLRRK